MPTPAHVPPPPGYKPSATPPAKAGTKNKYELTTLGLILACGALFLFVLALLIFVSPLIDERRERKAGERRVIKAHYDAEAEVERARVLSAGKTP